MEKLELKATDNTPLIKLDHIDNYILFKGESRPEQVQKFYTPVINWIKEYEKFLHFSSNQTKSRTIIVCEFYFEYFNSSSAKYIMDIIEMLYALNNDQINVRYIWCYDELDEDMKEAGEEFLDIVKANFDFKSMRTDNFN